MKMTAFNMLPDHLAYAKGKRIIPELDVFIMFDFYEGPKKGLATHSSGAYIRFSALADSPSRRFRAFELAGIEGNWLSRARKIEDDENGYLHRHLSERQREAMYELEQDAFRFPSEEYCVAVGAPNLEWLYVASASSEQLATLRAIDDESARFRAVHRFIKAQRLG